MKNYSLEVKWGVIFSVMTLLWMVLERFTGLHGEHIDKHAMYTNLIAIPAIAIYVLAMLDKRKNHYQGRMTYKQGFVTGLIITLVATILSPLVQIITHTVITPDYFPNIIEHVTTQEEMTKEAAKNYFNLKSYVIQAIIGAAIMGTLTSAIVALFTKQNPAKYYEQQ